MIRAFEAPSDARGLDELPLAQRQHLPAHDAHDVGPVDERDQEDDHAEPGLDRAAEAAAHGARGADAEARAAAPGSTARRRRGARAACRPSRGRSRRAARRDADHGGDRGADDADLERHARAVDDARHHVVAELVDAERVGGARAERAAERVGEVQVLDVRARQPEELDDQRRGDRDTISSDDERRPRPSRRGRAERRQNSCSGERAATSSAASSTTVDRRPRSRRGAQTRRRSWTSGRPHGRTYQPPYAGSNHIGEALSLGR